MKRESLIFFLGFALILLPFLGVPSMWKRVGYVVLGLTFVLLGYQLRRLAYLLSIQNDAGERRTDVYVEQMVTPSAQVDGPTIIRPDAGPYTPEETGPSQPKSRRVRTKKV